MEQGGDVGVGIGVGRGDGEEGEVCRRANEGDGSHGEEERYGWPSQEMRAAGWRGAVGAGEEAAGHEGECGQGGEGVVLLARAERVKKPRTRAVQRRREGGSRLA